MPELPEVETVCKGMEKAMKGRVIMHLEQRRKDLRVPFPDNFAHEVEGLEVLQIKRRAKYILMRLENSKTMILHLGMSGKILLVPSNENYEIKKHDHLILALDDDSKMVFNDARRFGMVMLTHEDELETHKAFRDMGPEPLGDGFSGAILFDSLENKKTTIKAALMDQRIVAGLGNIYVCEALFYAGIDPARIANTLSVNESEKLVQVILGVLRKAIKAGGSTLKDYQQVDGSLGYFQHQFAVYDKEAQACPDCSCDVSKTGGVKKITQAGRSTYYCPQKQK